MLIVYDTTVPEAIPLEWRPGFVAGYIDGNWPSYEGLRQRFPHAYHLSIAVHASHDAHVLDVENEDAVAAEVPGWIERQEARGWHRPWIYASDWTWSAQIAPLLAEAKIGRRRYRKWNAEPNGVPHVTPGFDGTQYAWFYEGLVINASRVLHSFIYPPPPDEPVSAPGTSLPTAA
jgi:hypothetical protein